MNDYAQKQNQSVEKKDSSSIEVRSETQEDNQKTDLCPTCNVDLPEEALFCQIFSKGE